MSNWEKWLDQSMDQKSNLRKARHHIEDDYADVVERRKPKRKQHRLRHQSKHDLPFDEDLSS